MALYLRELVARFAHLNGVEWSLGEEYGQSDATLIATANHLRALDPYGHHLSIHKGQNNLISSMPALLGAGSEISGAAVCVGWDATYSWTVNLRQRAQAAGRTWAFSADEQKSTGVPPDASPAAPTKKDVRADVLWGSLLAGGYGAQYYFHYTFDEDDLRCQDFRARDQAWDFARIARRFFDDIPLPLDAMAPRSALVSGARDARALVKDGEVYLVQLPHGGSASLNLAGGTGGFRVRWFDPRLGGELLTGSVETVVGGGVRSLGAPPSSPGEDWIVLVTRES
jgi:hypothetical protein